MGFTPGVPQPRWKAGEHDARLRELKVLADELGSREAPVVSMGVKALSRQGFPSAEDVAGLGPGLLGAWWQAEGRARFPGAAEILVALEGPPGTGPDRRQRESALQRFAVDSGLDVHVRHVPLVTRRWIEASPATECRVSKAGDPAAAVSITLRVLAAPKAGSGATGLLLAFQPDGWGYTLRAHADGASGA
jgi:hypothetical protein